MTEEERIKWNLRQLARVASDKDYYREWGAKAVVHYIRNVLGHIEYLLQPGPESLASSVLRLTNICNELGRENALLRNELTDMTLNYNAAEKHAKHLKEEVVRKDESLRACRAAEKVLKHNLEQAGWDATKLKRELALKEQCLMRVKSRLEWIKQRLESRSAEEENRKLKRELEEAKELKQDLILADIYTEELQADISKQNRYIEELEWLIKPTEQDKS